MKEPENLEESLALNTLLFERNKKRRPAASDQLGAMQQSIEEMIRNRFDPAYCAPTKFLLINGRPMREVSREDLDPAA